MVMDIKVEIGKKIKNARLNRGLTQADLCDDESELTIRQLARIERGQTMVTIPKLLFLAKQLHIPVRDLVDVEKIELPKGYVEIKRKVINLQTWGDPERIAQKEALLDEIYETYYDNLPEDEQIQVDAIQARIDIFSSFDATYGLGLLDEYFHQIVKKEKFTVNDLVIIELYFFCCAVGLEEKTYFDSLSEKVLSGTDYNDIESLTVLENIISTIISQTEPSEFPKYLTILKGLINETRHTYHNIRIFLFKAKYSLIVEKDKEKAKALYSKAKNFAELMGDQVLVSKIIEEEKADFPTG